MLLNGVIGQVQRWEVFQNLVKIQVSSEPDQLCIPLGPYLNQKVLIINLIFLFTSYTFIIILLMILLVIQHDTIPIG